MFWPLAITAIVPLAGPFGKGVPVVAVGLVEAVTSTTLAVVAPVPTLASVTLRSGTQKQMNWVSARALVASARNVTEVSPTAAPLAIPPSR
ncbi:MAG: hypothetical protein OXE48_10075, partial [Gammaproteobacteria bacterium]|nr:hypothetical protein [Gammaproteobacteria bacterium]